MLLQRDVSVRILQLMFMVASGTPSDPVPVARLSMRWRNEFCGSLRWDSTRDESDSDRCAVKYHVTVQTGEKPKEDFILEKPENKEWCRSTEERVEYSLRPLCPPALGCSLSPPCPPAIGCSLSPPCPRAQPADTMTVPQHTELLKDFQCFLHSSKHMNCSWLPTNHVPDLQFYYWFEGKAHTSPCTEYVFWNGVKTGFHLGEGTGFEKENVDVYFLVNGTLDGLPVQNIFLKKPMDNVKPPPPEMTIAKEGRRLVLSWAPPDIAESDCWRYVWNYTKCGEIMLPRKSRERDEVLYEPGCQYSFQVKAVYRPSCGQGESDLSPVQTYGADERGSADDWSVMVASASVPVLVFLVVIIALVCLRRHKSQIFPDIPEPSLIFKDMMKNNSKSQGNLYIPVQEVVESNVEINSPPTQPD